jgi:hypothetical protein
MFGGGTRDLIQGVLNQEIFIPVMKNSQERP